MKRGGGKTMARWKELEAEQPAFAARVQERFQAHRHSTMATLRRDGSPRISGTEVSFAGGEVELGIMPGALKAQDLQRDPRAAPHSASDDPPQDQTHHHLWPGDAKLSGQAVEVP